MGGWARTGLDLREVLARLALDVLGRDVREVDHRLGGNELNLLVDDEDLQCTQPEVIKAV